MRLPALHARVHGSWLLTRVWKCWRDVVATVCSALLLLFRGGAVLGIRCERVCVCDGMFARYRDATNGTCDADASVRTTGRAVVGKVHFQQGVLARVHDEVLPVLPQVLGLGMELFLEHLQSLSGMEVVVRRDRGGWASLACARLA